MDYIELLLNTIDIMTWYIIYCSFLLLLYYIIQPHVLVKSIIRIWRIYTKWYLYLQVHLLCGTSITAMYYLAIGIMFSGIRTWIRKRCDNWVLFVTYLLISNPIRFTLQILEKKKPGNKYNKWMFGVYHSICLL